MTMTEDKPIIEPERAGLWAAAAFILALVAFVLAFAGIYRSDHMIAATQIEVLALNHKIEDLRKAGGAPAPADEPAAEQPAVQ
jgi:hypothetical protein